jgi:hypothetical protein
MIPTQENLQDLRKVGFLEISNSSNKIIVDIYDDGIDFLDMHCFLPIQKGPYFSDFIKDVKVKCIKNI